MKIADNRALVAEKKLYIQPNTQLQLMNCTSLVCASGGGMSISGNSDLGIGGNSGGLIDPM